MQHPQLQPAVGIISKLGGPTAVARIAGVHRTRVSNWMRPRQAGGTGGVIPQKHIGKLIAHARANNIEIEPGAFLGLEEIEAAE